MGLLDAQEESSVISFMLLDLNVRFYKHLIIINKIKFRERNTKGGVHLVQK